MEIIGPKYADVWDILRKHRFIIETSRYEDLVCIICRGIVKNAHQNKCGCRYCYECIIDFIHSDGKYCPGPTEECRQKLIDNNSDLQIDHTANKAVANISVLCPISPCQVVIELKYMVQHIKSHKSQSQSSSSVSSSQCYDIDLSDLTPLNSYPIPQAKLLIDRIKLLNERVLDLNEQLCYSKETFKHLRSDVEEIQWTQNFKIDALEEINKKITEELKLAKKKLIISEENDKRNELVIKKLQQSIEEIKTKTTKKNREIDERLNKLEENYMDSEIKQEKLEEKMFALSSQSETHLSKTNKTKHDLGSCFELNSSLIESENFSPFVWKISDLSEKVTKAREGVNAFIFSDSFYSHARGYKMCLKLYPIGVDPASGRYLSLYFCIKKGPYDDFLPWPMTQQISLQLIDQKSDTIFCSNEYSYYLCSKTEKMVFSQPNTDLNSGIGSSEFVKINVLFNNKRILFNNSIVIKCIVGV